MKTRVSLKYFVNDCRFKTNLCLSYKTNMENYKTHFQNFHPKQVRDCEQ